MVIPAQGQGQGWDRSRLTVVLGGGGFRGLAHVGVLQALERAGVRPEGLVGTSSGALVAAAYAALGWSPDQIAAHALSLGPGWLARLALERPWLAGIQPLLSLLNGEGDPFLAGLARGSFGNLHNEVRFLGINTVDLVTREERFFVTSGKPPEVTLQDAVIGSASLPALFPGRRILAEGRRLHLVDGGLATTLAVDRAFEPPIFSEAVLAIDLRVATGWTERRLQHQAELLHKHQGRLLILKPEVTRVGTLFIRKAEAGDVIAAGRSCVTDAVVSWCRERLGLP